MKNFQKSISHYRQAEVCLFLVYVMIVFSSPVKGQPPLRHQSSVEDKHRIVVLEIQGQGITEFEIQTLTNYMRFELVETGVVTNVDGSQITEVLREMGDETGCVYSKCALEVAERLGASHVVMGSIRKVDRTFDLTFEMFNVKFGGFVQKAVNRTFQGDVDKLIVVSRRLIWDMMELTPPPGRFPPVSPTRSGADGEDKHVPRPSSIVTFTSSDWDIPKTITIYGLDDNIDDGDQTYTIVTGPVVSDDMDYGLLEPLDISGTNVDDDEVGIRVHPTRGLMTSEAGGEETFTVVLTSEPRAGVFLSISTSDTSEGTVSPSLLVFDRTNWNTFQTVTVRGVDDNVNDGNSTYTILVDSAISSDPNYSSLGTFDVWVTNMDDDVAGIRVHPIRGLMTSEVGGSSTFKVRLTSKPSNEVSLLLVSTDTSEGTVSPSLLVFDRTNWNTYQTMTLMGVEDDTNDGDQTYKIVIEPAVSDDPDYAGLDADDVSVINMDNQPGIIVFPTTLTTTEVGKDTSFILLLTARPTADVTFSLVSSDTTVGKVSPLQVTFTPDNWNTFQTVFVSGVNDDLDDGDQSCMIMVGAAATSDSNYIGLDPGDVSVVTTDDDQAGLIVNAASGLTTTEAGSTVAITVALASEPVANVTFSLVSSDATEGWVSPSSLTFTPANWNTAQTVTIKGLNDDVDDGDVLYNIVLGSRISSDDADYNDMDLLTVSVTNVDDDTSGITITPSSGLTTTEAEGVDMYSVVLNSEPTANVTVLLRSTDRTEGTVSSSSVTFTGSNWMIPHTITISGVNDNIDDGHQTYTIITGPVISDDLKYFVLETSDVSAINMDDDTRGITVYPISGLTTTEAGSVDTFKVVLASQPTGAVMISLSIADTTEGIVSPSSLTFTGRNWNEPQTVVITGVNDDTDDGDQTYNIVLGAAVSDDAGYNGLDPEDVSVTNTDDNEPGINVYSTAGLATVESGNTATFMVVLVTEPNEEVTVPLSSSDMTEGTVSPSAITFTSSSWDSAQSVTVIGVDDDKDDGDQTYNIIVGAAVSDDAGYNDLDPDDVSVINRDDDGPGIIVYPSGNITTTEAGDVATFMVVLTSEPTAKVTLFLRSSDATEGKVSPSTVIFKSRSRSGPSNWSSPQTVTITGLDDRVDDGDQMYTILVAAAVSKDTIYDGLDPDDVFVTNMDDDEAGIIVDPIRGLTTSEAGSETSFIMVLTSQPKENVTLSLRSSDETEGIVSPPSLTFTGRNWNVAQAVTIIGVNDAVDDGNQVYTVVIEPAVSGDPIYCGMNPPDVVVTNMDDDTTGIIVHPTGTLTTTEAGVYGMFTVVLTSEPTADVHIPLRSLDATEVSFLPLPDYRTPEVPSVANRPRRMITWMTAHPRVVFGLGAVVVGGGIAAWTLNSEQEKQIGNPPSFPSFH